MKLSDSLNRIIPIKNGTNTDPPRISVNKSALVRAVQELEDEIEKLKLKIKK